MDWVYYALLAVVQVVGLAITAMGLPGLWVMLLATLGYAWLTGWSYMGVWWLAGMTLLCLASEAAEFFAGAAAAKAAGGSKRAMIISVIGAVVGSVVFTPIFVIPVVAQIAGAVLGAGIGGVIGELTTGRGTTASLRVGYGAAKGRFVGTVLKLVFGVVLLLAAMAAGFPWGGRKVLAAPGGNGGPGPAAPVTLPTTAAATGPG